MNPHDTLYEFILRQLNVEAEAAEPNEEDNFSSLACREKLAQNIAGNLAMRDMALAAELATALERVWRWRLQYPWLGLADTTGYSDGKGVMTAITTALVHARAEGVLK